MRRQIGWLALITILASLAHSASSDPDTWSLKQAYSDEFNAPDLDPRWSFVNPASNPSGQSWSLTSNPGFLTMTSTGPTDLIGATNTAPRMVQVAPTGDFRIVVHVLAAPDIAFEHAGILVMSSPTNWVRLIRDYLNNSVYLQAGPVAEGEYIPFSGSDVTLRLTKRGYSYEGAYSTDNGATYTIVGDINGTSIPSQIGTVVASTPVDNVFTAQFDYFRFYAENPEMVPLPTLSVPALVALALLLILCGLVVLRRFRFSA